MNIYELRSPAHRYGSLVLSTKPSDEFFYQFDGRALAASWSAPEVNVTGEESANTELADFMLLGTIPVLSARAVSKLGDMVQRNGELLPLKMPGADLLAYNVFTTIDALDEQASVVSRFPSGRVMSVANFVFVDHAVDGKAIFRIPQLPRAYVFVTDVFTEIVQRGALTGFLFLPVWTSPQT